MILIADQGRSRHSVAALKADTLSLSSWQLGMYGWMAVVSFLLVGEVVVVITGAYLINSEYIFKHGADPMAGMAM